MAAELLASLDDEPDEDVEAMWAAEIERRAKRVMTEGSHGRTWEQVRNELRRAMTLTLRLELEADKEISEAAE